MLKNLRSLSPGSLIKKTLAAVASCAILISTTEAADVVAGSIPGESNVSPGGAATYSIPVEVPPGINGIQPDLALVYNSQSGNGLLGMGWSLSGLSSIARCGKTLEQDNEIHSVDFTDADRLCLDGQRLIPTTGTNTDAGYWSAYEYRTEIESFLKVTHLGSGFKVETKEGRVAEYGNSIDSAQNVASTAEPMSWAVNKISDQFNNSIVYTYNEDIINGEHNINIITYANNVVVTFNYEPRSDRQYGFTVGGPVNQVNRLSDINISLGTQVVVNYDLIYKPNAVQQSSQITNINKCNADKCLPPLSFEWEVQLSGFNAPKLAIGANSAGGAPSYSFSGKKGYLADVTGDGKADRVWMPSGRDELWVAESLGESFTTPVKWLAQGAYPGILNYSYGSLSGTIADVNGDGMADRVWIPDGRSDIWVALSTGSSFLKAEIWLPANAGGVNVYSWSRQDESYADMDGDGLVDRVWAPDGRTEIWVALSDGTRFQTPTRWTSRAEIGVHVTSDNGNYRFFTDINGDGMTDRVWIPAGTPNIWVAISTGRSFKKATQWLSASDIGGVSVSSWAGKNSHYADVNGDGLPDQVWLPNGRSDIWVAISTGSSFERARAWLPANSGGIPAYSWDGKSEHYFDINADGLSDKIWVPDGINQLWVSLSDGKKFLAPQRYLNIGDAGIGNTINSDLGQRTLYGDINGDGSIDRVWMPENQSYLYSATTKSITPKIISYDNGIGIKNTINYRPITDSIIYTKGSTAQYPVMDVQTAIHVVSSVSSDDGIGGKNVIAYKYAGMKAHKRGLGSLGFRQIETVDRQTGIINKTEFSQEYPYIGAAIHAEVRQKNFQLLSLSDTSYTYSGTTCLRYPVSNWLLPDCGLDSPGTISPYSDGEKTTKRDLNGALIKVIARSIIQSDFNDNFAGSINSIVTTTGPSGMTYQQVASNIYLKNSSPIYYEKGQLSKSENYAIDDGASSEVIKKTFTYNLNGQLKTDILEPDTTNWLKKTYGYDNFGNRTTVTISGENIISRTSNTTFDMNGQFPLLNKNAMGHIEKRTYDPRFGVMTSRTDPNGLSVISKYDDFGQKITEVTTRGNRSEISRKWCDIDLGHTCIVPAITPQEQSQVVKTILTSRKKGSDLIEFMPEIKIYLDKFGREIRKETTGFDGTKIYVDTNYDGLGRIVAKTQPYYSSDALEKKSSRFEYDILGRIIHRYTPTGTHNDAIYNGLVVTMNSHVQNPARTETTVETRNAIGQLLSVRDNAFQTVRFGYNPQGKRISTTDPQGNVILINYDKFGRKISMNDPDMGIWSYAYDALGELISQENAKSQVTRIQYDTLGRMIRRNDADGLVSAWYYNDNLNAGNTPRNKAIGMLDYETSSNGYRKDVYYDNYGAPLYTVINISGSSYLTTNSYDKYGRLDKLIYPQSTGTSRFEIQHGYKNGFLEKITSPDNLITYWQADFMRASGQVQHESYGNGLKIMRDFDAGERVIWLDTGDATSLYQAYYTYDSIGNLTERKSQRNQGGATELIENYTYDSLSRLTDVGINSLGNVSMTYDGMGNIQSKTGIGVYTYYTDRPHAVKTANGNTYNYDANGNMLSGAGRSIVWSSYNKPTHISKGTARSDFLYGPSRQRFYQFQTKGTLRTDKTVHYVGNHFEKEIKNGVIEYRHYIRAAGKAIAVHSRKSNNVTTTDYLLRDYQGSVVAIADVNGKIKGHMDYDAFGARRPILGLSQLDQIIESFSRGYTGHEHLDNVGLIHMNGRVYEPLLGRFLSTDPIVQDPNNLQSLNRYAYVFNNPMSYTDPSGFKSFKKKLRRALKASVALSVFSEVINKRIIYSKPVTKFFLKYKLARVAGQAAATYFGGAGGAAGFAAYITDISGGSLRDIAKAAIAAGATAYAMQQANAPYVRNGNVWSFSRVLDNGVVGGTASYFQGGSFGKGFLTSAGISLLQYGYNEYSGGASLGALYRPDGANPLNAILDTAGKLWNLPNTVLGLAYGAVGYVVGMVNGTNPFVNIGNNAIQFHNSGLMPSAMTLGNVIIYGPNSPVTGSNINFVNTPLNFTVGSEESLHTVQGEILGPFYLPAHVVGGVSSLIRIPNIGLSGRVDAWHSNNFMEIGPMQGSTF